MHLLDTSYSDDRRKRQPSSSARNIAIAMSVLALAGCSGIGGPFGDVAVDQSLTTGSIQKVSARASDTVDQSDWNTVRRAIASIDKKNEINGPVDWSNPITGSTGTITIRDAISPTIDPNCLNFETTINDMRGIRRYRGKACHMTDDRWQLVGVLADDSKLL
jgi:hypothetical protein